MLNQSALFTHTSKITYDKLCQPDYIPKLLRLTFKLVSSRETMESDEFKAQFAIADAALLQFQQTVKQTIIIST
jgi:hypothetical protein